MKRFNAWKSDSKCEPIEDTDRILSGISKRTVLKHLAFEEGVEHKHNDMVVKLNDGTMWCVSQI